MALVQFVLPECSCFYNCLLNPAVKLQLRISMHVCVCVYLFTISIYVFVT